MAPKTKRRRQPAAPRVELIVRRGADRRFQKLKEKTGHLPVKVVWDRREDERRSVSEGVERDRRNGDRRQKPPFTWELGDFVLVEKVKRRAPRVRKVRS